jgi:aspartate kinase
LDLHSTQMLGAYGFLARIFSEFEKHKLSVDVLASSEVSVSLTLDKKQPVSTVTMLMDDLKDCATITRQDNMSILTLIADVNRSSEVLATVFRVFASQKIKVEMMSQGASKVNISFILKSDVLESAIAQLHSCFFENVCVVDMVKEETSTTTNSDEDKVSI